MVIMTRIEIETFRLFEMILSRPDSEADNNLAITTMAPYLQIISSIPDGLLNLPPCDPTRSHKAFSGG